jgi:hypothetical protein
VRKYYCHKCALEHGIIDPLYPEESPYSTSVSLSGTRYQLGKFIKHTVPSGRSGIVSIFADPTYQEYENYTITTSLSGCCEIDEMSRINLVWYAGKEAGIIYKDGKFKGPADGVKVVLHDDETKIHAFPIDYENMNIQRCLICGEYIPG